MATGKELKNAIRGKGLTVEAAAGILGISRQTLSTHMGKGTIGSELIQNVKEKLDISLSESKGENIENASDIILQLAKAVADHAKTISGQEYVIRKYIEKKEAPDIKQAPKNVSTLSKLRLKTSEK